MKNLKRYDLETVQACGVEVTTMERADEGPWVRYDDVVQHILEVRNEAHGDGQMHAIADVNAGLIDDLIHPRLHRARFDLEEAR